ncbi:MAG: hypothetical protein ACTSQI_14830 [Candidatus Helarchaeota archaeon]
MAVYQKKLPFLERIITQIFGPLERIMNFWFNRRLITFFYRNSKFGKVTRLLEKFNISLST